jgi:hypothetical protein
MMNPEEVGRYWNANVTAIDIAGDFIAYARQAETHA